jgi:hypothetical protein
MRKKLSRKQLVPVVAALAAMVMPLTAAAQLATGLQGASGSTVGPDGALYVTEGLIGRVTRVDPATGAISTFAEGLPGSLIGIGGAVDVAFIDETAYVLVTIVGFPFGGNVDGIYRVDGPGSFTVIADLGTFSASNPPATPFDLPNGVQYAMEPYRGGFLVTDGHHNRVLRVTLDGGVSEFIAFDNIVPTGLEVIGKTIYMGQAGASPHLPADGKVVAFDHKSSVVTEVASGAPLLVDVERGRGRTLYALAQGIWEPGFPGSPANPDTGSLVELNADGSVSVVAEGLDRPTSFEIINNTAYVVTLDGEIWVIGNLSGPPFGKRH